MNPMKQLILPLFAAACLLASCDAPADAPAAEVQGAAVNTGLQDGNYIINKVKPKVTWAATKLTGDGHDGTLHIESGKFTLVNGEIATGKVIFDMKRIEVTDLTGEDKANLEGHLRSGDFFNVETHPKATLAISGVQESNGQNMLNATLTLNGKAVDYTIPVEMVEAEVPGGMTGLAIQGKFDMDRTKHDITYHSQTFDDKLDWFIKDEVTVGFSVIGVPAAI
jgi:polyisoprenoid-binding protein YceI